LSAPVSQDSQQLLIDRKRHVASVNDGSTMFHKLEFQKRRRRYLAPRILTQWSLSFRWDGTTPPFDRYSMSQEYAKAKNIYSNWGQTQWRQGPRISFLPPFNVYSKSYRDKINYWYCILVSTLLGGLQDADAPSRTLLVDHRYSVSML
jgi:hypothetical protein